MATPSSALSRASWASRCCSLQCPQDAMAAQHEHAWEAAGRAPFLQVKDTQLQ